MVPTLSISEEKAALGLCLLREEFLEQLSALLLVAFCSRFKKCLTDLTGTATFKGSDSLKIVL